MRQDSQQRISVPHLQDLAQQAKQQSQDLEIQLRVVALSNAVNVAEKGEKLATTMARVGEFTRYLCSGVAVPTPVPILKK